MGYSAQLFLRTDYTKKDGTNPVYLRVIINRKKKDYSLNISVSPKHWNSKKEEVKLSASDAMRKNLILQKSLNKANDIFFNYQIKDKYLNLYEFDRVYNNESFNSESFYEFVEKQIRLSDGKLAKGTLHVYRTQLSKLKLFRASLDFGQVDVVFLKEYESYMLNELKNKSNTVAKSMSFIRSILNKAKQEGLIESNVFNDSKFEIKKVSGERQYLTMDEIVKLELLRVSDKLTAARKNVLSYFLFSCYTGLRYSDVRRLRFKNVSDGILRMSTQKTKQVVEFPMTSKAKALIGTGLDEAFVFRVLADQATNRYLKDICKVAGISKHISFHCARHSFATNSLELGVPIEVVQSVLGHSEIKETLTYSRITQKQKELVVEKWG